MTAPGIMAIVAGACGVTVERMQSYHRIQMIVWAKYIAVMMMIEEGYTPEEINGQFPDHHKTTIGRIPRVFDDLITTHQPFKQLYLECIRQYSIAVGDL